MIEISEEQFRQLIALAGGSLVLLVGMFVYCVRSSRDAYLGGRWVRAAGSRARAVRALREFEHETEALVVQHAYRFELTGAAILINREAIEALIAQADQVNRGSLDVTRVPSNVQSIGAGRAPDAAEECLDCGHSYGIHHARNAGGCRRQGCACPNFRGRVTGRDVVCCCGHGKTTHQSAHAPHLPGPACRVPGCGCAKFSAITVEP